MTGEPIVTLTTERDPLAEPLGTNRTWWSISRVGELARHPVDIAELVDRATKLLAG